MVKLKRQSFNMKYLLKNIVKHDYEDNISVYTAEVFIVSGQKHHLLGKVGIEEISITDFVSDVKDMIATKVVKNIKLK